MPTDYTQLKVATEAVPRTGRQTDTSLDPWIEGMLEAARKSPTGTATVTLENGDEMVPNRPVTEAQALASLLTSYRNRHNLPNGDEKGGVIIVNRKVGGDGSKVRKVGFEIAN